MQKRVLFLYPRITAFCVGYMQNSYFLVAYNSYVILTKCGKVTENRVKL